MNRILIPGFLLAILALSVCTDSVRSARGQDFRDPFGAQSGPATNNSITSGIRDGQSGRQDDIFLGSPQSIERAVISPGFELGTENSFVPGFTPSTTLTPPSLRGDQTGGNPLSRPPRNPTDVDTSGLESIQRGSVVRREPLSALRRQDAEVVVQNYPDGKKMLEKEMNLDPDGNYQNHGFWRVYNRAGGVQAVGQFENGKMEGVWTRLHSAGDGGIFLERPFNMFNAPFKSVATFRNDVIDGRWTIRDQNDREIFEIEYQNGVRNGVAVWRYPNGSEMRVAFFKDGLLEGTLSEWDQNAKLSRKEEFSKGRRIISQTTYYRPGVPSGVNNYLDGRVELDGPDDWWAAKPAGMKQTGEPVQHGPVVALYENKQPQMRGEYREGKPVGRFQWWHPNGSKQGQGYFDDGMKVGKWTWWHDNGMKQFEGEFQNDEPVGEWFWWTDDGRLKERENKDERGGDDRGFEPGANTTDPTVDPAVDPADMEAREPENTGDLVIPDSLDRENSENLESIDGVEKEDSAGAIPGTIDIGNDGAG